MKDLKERLVVEKASNSWSLSVAQEKVIFACIDFVMGKAKDKDLAKMLSEKFAVDEFVYEELYQDFSDQLNKYESKLSGRISNAVSKL